MGKEATDNAVEQMHKEGSANQCRHGQLLAQKTQTGKVAEKDL